MSHRTSSIVQIIFSVWSFEISEGILRNQHFMIGLDTYSNQGLINFDPFQIIRKILVFVSTTLLKVTK